MGLRRHRREGGRCARLINRSGTRRWRSAPSSFVPFLSDSAPCSTRVGYGNQAARLPINKNATQAMSTNTPIRESGQPMMQSKNENTEVTEVTGHHQCTCTSTATLHTTNARAAVSQRIPVVRIPRSPIFNESASTVVLYGISLTSTICQGTTNPTRCAIP